MYGYIYKTTCLITKLIYIGQHKAIKFEPKRYIGSGCRLKAAINEFGKENFICELLDTAENLEELNSKEEYWVEFYRSRDPLVGYNVKKGGEQLGLTGCCKIRRGEETLVVEKASVKPYIDAGWYLTNTEETRAKKAKQYTKSWYEKNKEHCLAKQKEWRDANKEYRRNYYETWRIEHNIQPKKPKKIKPVKKKKTLEERKAARKQWEQQYYLKHKEEIKARNKNYQEANKEKCKKYYQERYQNNKELYKERVRKSRELKKLKNTDSD